MMLFKDILLHEPLATDVLLSYSKNESQKLRIRIARQISEELLVGPNR